MKLKYLLLLSLVPMLCQGQTFKSFKQTNEGIAVTLTDGTLSVYPLTDNSVRVKFSKGVETPLQELVFISKTQTPEFKVIDAAAQLEIKRQKDYGGYR